MLEARESLDMVGRIGAALSGSAEAASLRQQWFRKAHPRLAQMAAAGAATQDQYRGGLAAFGIAFEEVPPAPRPEATS